MHKRAIDQRPDVSESKDMTNPEPAAVAYEPVGRPCKYTYLREGFTKKTRINHLPDFSEDEENISRVMASN